MKRQAIQLINALYLQTKESPALCYAWIYALYALPLFFSHLFYCVNVKNLKLLFPSRL